MSAPAAVPGEEKSFLTLSDGCRLRLRHRPCENPRARVLLIHGMAEHSGRYTHVSEFYVERGYEVFSVDQRGHGESGLGSIDPHSFQVLVRDLGEVLASLKTDLPLCVHGHSMGGLVSLGLALGKEEKIDFLILSSPALDARISPSKRMMGELFAKIWPSFPIRTPINGEMLSKDPKVGLRAGEDPLWKQTATARFGVSFVRAMRSYQKRLPELRLPTLVLHGEADPLVPEKSGRDFEGLPGVERITFPELRHELHNEAEWRKVLSRAADWLQDEEGKG